MKIINLTKTHLKIPVTSENNSQLFGGEEVPCRTALGFVISRSEEAEQTFILMNPK